MAELSAPDARLDEAAAVARTLIDGDDLNWLEVALERCKRERQRHLDMPPHLEAKGFRINAERDAGEVIADEKGVVGRQHAFVVNGKRGFELRRPDGLLDQRTFPRVAHEGPVAIGEPQSRGVRRERAPSVQ